jgi:hypothetical protein
MEKEYKNLVLGCQNCKKDFVIEPDDFSFYEKIKVPAPTFCLDCRQQRRYSWRNERTLYRRNCDLCGNSTVTIYHPSYNHKVFCSKCWWGDEWDAKETYQEFDFSKSFFTQFKELQLKVPRLALLNKNSINSEYSNHGHDNKNCYLCTSTLFSENVLYSVANVNSKDCSDCYRLEDNNSSMYEVSNSYRSFNCQFGSLLTNCMDCYYCFDCKNCSDCFMSSNLRNKKYIYENIQLTKEEYQLKISKLDLYSIRVKLYEEYIKILKNKAIHKYAILEKVVDSSGNLIFNSKNTTNCFEVGEGENCKNVYVGLKLKDCRDCYHIGGKNIDICYDSHAISGSYLVLFSHMSYDNSFIEYCDSVHNSNNLFGCIGIRKGEYCILNKQYTKEEYLDLKEKIIKHMKKTGEYGEFFPTWLSPFGYNETQAQVYMPITKEEALMKGFKWQDDIPFVKNRETLESENLPDSIDDISDKITEEILKCIKCDRNYNIIKQELDLYKKLNVPIPRKCPNCRYIERLSLRSERKLWHRSCMKEGCTNTFETSYAPDRPEIVYCESCYQQEVY